ncbi:1-acyl-sn-glycerol-3-phosphate acyltransferase [Gordonia spumicola]|uniref:1-acyl-sn-glycerol-3-phosphate acyltransferase n=1 Tax=Gordonia spumicola TaxID=589161 RepID=A0A7I9V4U1_9ACTN|nr:lysophospholipid acyltransferase family protein [Gordonia spumicola]GEE00445.1 1-acyl-sn-glycerol-3-phosphate acyltransferase [Gordonia spumicola]
MEPVYRTLELIAGTIHAVQGTRRTVAGLDNVPESGGAVIAVNHTGYTDFMPLGLALRKRRRRARFLVKSELTDIGVMRFLVKHARAVPVDRSAGADAYRVAVDDLRAGELVGVYPEATISRSFELKEFKTGAVRMAIDAGVPVIPTIVWGAHRQWSKGVRRRMGRTRIPIDVAFGEPLHFAADDDPADAAERLRTVMVDLLYRVQDAYPDAPAGADWLPARLGGSAPTPDHALILEDAEAAEKAARRAAKREKKK